MMSGLTSNPKPSTFVGTGLRSEKPKILLSRFLAAAFSSFEVTSMITAATIENPFYYLLVSGWHIHEIQEIIDNTNN